MSIRYGVSGLALALLVGVPGRAADKDVKTPAIVVRVKSIDGLIEDAKYVAKLSGNEEEAKQGEGFLRSFLGEKGKEAIDPTLPIGFYAAVSEDFLNSNGALMLPVANEKSLVEFLERFGGQAKKGDDGIYTLTHPGVPVPVPIYMRVENKYAYVTAQNKASLKKENLLDPAQVFGTDKPKTVSISLSMDRVPGDAKDFALGFLDARFAEEQGKTEPGETKAQQAFRVEILKELARQATSLIKESGKAEVYFDVDQKAQELVADVVLTGRKGSKLAANISEFSRHQSLVAKLGAADAAARVMAHIMMPDKIRQALEPVIDEALTKAMQNMNDDAQRRQADKFFKAVAPTLKSGELDVAVSLHGPTTEKHYTIVAGLKVKDGQGIDTAFRELVKSIPERDRQAFKFDTEKVGGVSVHRIEAQSLYHEAMRTIVGENAVHIAARADLVVVAVGPDAAGALKAALTAQPGTGPLFGSEVAVAKIVPLIGAVESVHAQKATPGEVEKLAKDAFANGEKGNDLVRLTITGGDAFKARYTLKADAFQFITRAGLSYRMRAAAGDE